MNCRGFTHTKKDRNCTKCTHDSADSQSICDSLFDSVFLRDLKVCYRTWLITAYLNGVDYEICIYQCNDHTYHLKAGDAFLIRPMESIYYRADSSDPWSYAWAGFDGSACKEILKQTVFSDSLIFTPETPSRQNSLLTHMQSLLDTFSENNGNVLASTGNLLLMLSDMQKKPSESRTDTSTLYFQKASEYIRNNYAYPIQISDVARYVGIDRSYLYRIFMEHENTSPKQYLLKHRLQMAALLLCSSSYTITESALSCGFRDAPSFCNYFRQRTGYTPKEFRRVYNGTIYP